MVGLGYCWRWQMRLLPLFIWLSYNVRFPEARSRPEGRSSRIASVDSAEDRLRRRGLSIEIFANESLAEAMPHLDDNPDIVGFLSVLPGLEGTLIVNALTRPGAQLG